MTSKKNAILLSAGTSSRFAPLSYELPKGLLRVKGEVLIERQIRQLKEAGIHDITIVVGYKKELFYYLKQKFDVEIVVNEDFYRYNNPSSLMCVIDKISNTFICSSDNYFTENVFRTNITHAFYAAIYAEGKTNEWCLNYDTDGKITNVTIGGSDSWYMLGHSYFSPEFSAKFTDILKHEYKNNDTRLQLWEALYARHIKELPMYIQKFNADIIKEFDTLDELRTFDESYLENSGSKIMQFIANQLHCKESEITKIEPITSGLTNKSFKFDLKNQTYIFHYPENNCQKI